MPASKVNNEDFVVAWMTSDSIDAVAVTTGMKKPTISARAKYLRDKGVNLPKITPKSRGLDKLEVAQLNSLIKRYAHRKAQTA